MKKMISLAVFCLAVFAPLAGAYEYPLQFTPNAGYRGLVVAGYGFDANNDVVGNCSYFTVSGNSGSGKGGGGHAPVNKSYLQTCKWDMYGNLLGVTQGAPAIPSPVSTDGSKLIFAINANGQSTGVDVKNTGHGFVRTPGPHYTWLTPASNGVLHQFVYTLSATLKSDGDVPVDITAVAATALNGTAVVQSTTCNGQIEVDATCAITVTYDPTNLASSTGLASDTLRIELTSSAGASHDFVQNYTVILPNR